MAADEPPPDVAVCWRIYVYLLGSVTKSATTVVGDYHNLQIKYVIAACPILVDFTLILYKPGNSKSKIAPDGIYVEKLLYYNTNAPINPLFGIELIVSYDAIFVTLPPPPIFASTYAFVATSWFKTGSKQFEIN